MKQLPCLILRLRMPVSDDLHSRSFVTKIIKYDHVVDVENSNSVLHDLLPAAVLLADHRDNGVYNFTNPGAISHNEVSSSCNRYVPAWDLSGAANRTSLQALALEHLGAHYLGLRNNAD